MPIENEVKFVINDLHLDLFENLTKRRLRRQSILQVYLKKGVRLRRIEEINDYKTRYVFTFKQDVDAGRNVEIETDISEDDFSILSKRAEVVLHKDRFKFRNGFVHWDVDFFRQEDEVYFVIAEAEMPASHQYPETIPSILRPYIAYVVPRHRQKYYQSRKLARRDYAAQLMKEISLMEKE